MKIICIGRNYADHAAELNNPLPAKPVFFMKPDSALLLKNKPFYIPEFSNEVHYETELVVKIDRLGKHIEPKFAHRYYSQVSLGIDFTARDLQDEQKKKGLPWEIAKAFDYSAVLGEFVSLKELPSIQELKFQLDIDGTTMQKGFTGQMIFNVDTIIAYVSQFVTLKIGDLIYTGTPQGVGPVKVGQRLTASLEGKTLLDFEIK